MYTGFFKTFLQECDLFYLNRSSLHKHRRMYHNPDNPMKIDQNNLKCRYCSKSFLSIRQKQIHIFKNYCTKGKPVCQICQKTYPSPYSLSRHMHRSHTLLDTCPHCQNQYSQRQLKRHLKTIHQERKCHHCQEVFYIYERYHEHLLSHNVDIRCGVCGKDLRMGNIEKHMQKWHQNQASIYYICNCQQSQQFFFLSFYFSYLEGVMFGYVIYSHV